MVVVVCLLDQKSVSNPSPFDGKVLRDSTYDEPTIDTRKRHKNIPASSLLLDN